VSVLRLNISNLSEGTHHRSLVANPDEIGLDTRFSKPISLRATLEKSSRQLYLLADFKTSGTFTCDRCLDEFEREIAGSYRLLYVTDESGAVGINQEEVQIISPEANYIELDEDVRQFAILAIPQKMLCGDTCAGLCPHCGKNLNRGSCDCPREEMDPRWEGLKKYLDN
jgi:uncharacterized protein